MISGRESTLVAAYKVYQKFKIPLVVELQNGLFSPAVSTDDLGIFFYTPPLANFFNLEPVYTAHLLIKVLAVLFIVVTAIGFFPLAENWKKRFLILFFLSLFLIKLLGLADVYIAYAFVFLPISLFLSGLKKKNLLYFNISMFFTGFVFVFSHHLRKYSFLPALILVSFYLLFDVFLSKKQKTIGLMLCLLGGSIPFSYFSYSLSQRVLFLRQQGQIHDLDPGYGLWHGVYMGFGFIKNKYNIIYSDGCGLEHAKEIDPTVRAAGKPKCEMILRRLIFDLFKKDRHFVLITFFAKFGVACMFFLIWFGWIGLFFSYLYPKPWYEEVAFFLAIIVGMLPGILTRPHFQYLLGGITCTVLYTVYSILSAWDKQKKIL